MHPSVDILHVFYYCSTVCMRYVLCIQRRVLISKLVSKYRMQNIIL